MDVCYDYDYEHEQEHEECGCRGAFKQQRTFMRAGHLAAATLGVMGRKTITNLLVTSSQQFQDCSAAFRLFSKDRFDPDALFASIAQQVHQHLLAGTPFVAAIDDTLLGKSGRKIAGAAFRRDPLGPKFHVNLRWAQRFLQGAVTLPAGPESGAARTIPVDFHHAHTPRKPKKYAPPEHWQAYETERKEANLCERDVQRIHPLRTIWWSQQTSPQGGIGFPVHFVHNVHYVHCLATGFGF